MKKGSGDISLNYWSGCGSGRPKKIWILRIRMRIRNTDHNSGSKFFFLPVHRLVQEPVPKNLNIKNVLLINKIIKIWIWRNVKKYVLPVDHKISGSGSRSGGPINLRILQNRNTGFQASIVSVHGPPRFCFEPLKLLHSDFNVDPNLAFHSNADPDLAPINNVDPDLQPWLKEIVSLTVEPHKWEMYVLAVLCWYFTFYSNKYVY